MVLTSILPAFSGKTLLHGEFSHSLECFWRPVGQSLFLGSSFAEAVEDGENDWRLTWVTLEEEESDLGDWHKSQSRK